MNREKLKQLFGAAKRERAVQPLEGFDMLVMQQIRRNPARAPFSVFEELGNWFPRLALASAAVIAVCVAGEIFFSSTDSTFNETAAQLSAQTLLAEN